MSGADNIYKGILDDMSNGIVIIDMDCNIQYINKSLESEFGVHDGKKCYDYFNDRATPCPFCNNAEISKGRIFEWEWSCQKNNKVYKLVDKPIVFNGIIAKLEVFHDITKQRKFEDELKLEKQFVESIISTAQAIILVLDREGKIVTFNPYMEETSGYLSEEVIGEDWFDNFIPERDREKIRTVFRAAINDIQTRGNINPIVCKDGKEIIIEWYDKTLRNIDDEVIGLIAIGQDITARKEYETKLISSLREKEVLMQEIHHRVKNNLQVVSGLIGLQLSYVEDETYRAMFIESQSRIKSISLVHDKLYRSKGLAEIDLKEYILSLSNDLLSSLGVDKSSLMLTLDVETVLIGMDKAIPCGLIINELFTNILKHAFPDKIIGEINISVCSKNNDDIELTISDNGVGFPEDVDFRNSKSLGLHIVNILVKQLEGTIELDRTRGSKFRVIFNHGHK
ncbi:PAS domain S-box protein [Candidatus Magnetominusculus dajiuhuensis]|uniref:sensor histidine kinase n=1 Tax=Candidatus Magnetominusculus dajiuhuensis TaxID=3137712 RepID=UPI003B43B7C3